jgi:hypothetical protein
LAGLAGPALPAYGGAVIALDRFVPPTEPPATGPGARFVIAAPVEALAYRASLPGASGYDAATAALAGLSGGSPSLATELALLPLILPTSWLVNSTATSRTFRALRSEPCRQAWEAILTLLPREMGLEEWSAEEPAFKLAVSGFVRRLTEVEGGSLVAVSKIVALLRPRLGLLLDDAAVAFALGSVPPPTRADAPTAPWTTFVPMLDWFAVQVAREHAALAEVARAHAEATATALLEPAQVLDRLLWVVSWGDPMRGQGPTVAP